MKTYTTWDFTLFIFDLVVGIFLAATTLSGIEAIASNTNGNTGFLIAAVFIVGMISVRLLYGAITAYTSIRSDEYYE